MMRGRASSVLAGLLAFASALACSRAHTQQAYVEPKDATRLDVERLPPEAIELTRDVYAHGFYLEGFVGGRGFSGGLGRYAEPGLWASVLVGYEVAPWLMLAAGVELSMHAMKAPSPPAALSFERINALFTPRLQLAFSERAAMFIGPELVAGVSPGDMLRVYGFNRAHELGVGYGGSLGFDWHLANRHHSLGLLAGARLEPSLQGVSGEVTIAIHSAAYLKYVF